MRSLTEIEIGYGVERERESEARSKENSSQVRNINVAQVNAGRRVGRRTTEKEMKTKGCDVDGAVASVESFRTELRSEQNPFDHSTSSTGLPGSGKFQLRYCANHLSVGWPAVAKTKRCACARAPVDAPWPACGRPHCWSR